MDEEYIYAPDITFTNLDRTVLYPDGCIYNRAAIVCPQDKRKDGDCDNCGWNPRVAHRRSYLIRKEMYEQDVGNSV